MWARLLVCVIFFTIPLLTMADEPSSKAGFERFEKKIRPLLASRCWSCHGAEKTKGGLRLDSAEAMARGGDAGETVLPGKPEESLLIRAVRYVDELKMPPKGKLSDSEVAELVEWVKQGASWPEGDTKSTACRGQVFDRFPDPSDGWLVLGFPAATSSGSPSCRFQRVAEIGD